MLPYMTALLYFDGDCISGVGGLCFKGDD